MAAGGFAAAWPCPASAGFRFHCSGSQPEREAVCPVGFPLEKKETTKQKTPHPTQRLHHSVASHLQKKTKKKEACFLPKRSSEEGAIRDLPQLLVLLHGTAAFQSTQSVLPAVPFTFNTQLTPKERKTRRLGSGAAVSPSRQRSSWTDKARRCANPELTHRTPALGSNKGNQVSFLPGLGK